MLLSLLGNRTIRPRSAALLFLVGDGPYVSDSTIALLGRSHVALARQYASAFAHAAVPDPPGMSRLTSPSAVSAIRRRISSGNVVSKPAEVAAAFRSSRLTEGQELMLELYVRAVTSTGPGLPASEYLKGHRQRQ